MANPTRIEVDCSTGIATEIELTDDEVAELAVQAELAAQAQAEREAEAEAKAIAKAEAIAALVALGLTEAQIAALTA
jgi:Holliday junction resolvasome RuvABC DNA-binding subunit